jgi:hypothetical protein
MLYFYIHIIEVFLMTNISKFYISLSFLILLFNGSSLGFILFNERLGGLYGIAFFSFFSLFGASLALLAEEGDSSFYCKYCFFGNMISAFLPLFYFFASLTLFPDLIAIFP